MLGHWLMHVLGLDTQQSPYYNFWSGVSTQFKISYLLLPALYYHKHNCHKQRCWRIGRHHVAGTPWCNRHHEDARTC